MEQIKQFFSDNDQLAKSLGTELLEVSPGYAKGRITIRKEHLNGVNITHGGTIFSLADFTFAAASNSHGTIAVALAFLAVYGLMFVGAWRMMHFKNWGLALTSAILMLIPCTFCWVGLPFGIWAIIVLSAQSTRDQFE